MSDDTPEKAKPGPKPKLVLDDKTLDTIRKLGFIQATVAETASVLLVSERTLQNFFAANPEAKEAHEGGIMQGRSSLRRKQFAMAEKNAAMAIFLGKQYLGQKDKSEVQVNHYDAMTDDQLRDQLRAAFDEARSLGVDIGTGGPSSLN